MDKTPDNDQQAEQQFGEANFQEANEASPVQEERTSGSIEDTELRSEEVQEILSQVPHWMIRWGSTLFLALILLVLAISWFVKYPDIIASEVMVTTKTPPQKEYATITAKIDTIFVEDNAQVAKNTPLAILENTANYEDVRFLKNMIGTISLNNRSFRFPVNMDSLPILFLGEIDDDFALFENSYIQYTLNKELQPFDNESIANQRSLIESRNRLSNLLVQKKLAETELTIKKTDRERYKDLLDKGAASRQEYETKASTYIQAEQSLNSINLQISQIRESISNASKTSKGTDINRKKEEMNLLKSLAQSFNQLKNAIKDWELRYVLQSDLKGKVSFMDVWTVNQTVNTGDLIFTIVPSENSSYIAKLKAPAQNSGKIKVGQTVNIKLENYPDNEYGVLKGQIENIALTPDKDGLYNIRVSLPEKLITTYSKEIEFKQEMQGIAEIITEDLRLIERFFYQLKNVFTR